jgi:predicted transcriptional regulator
MSDDIVSELDRLADLHRKNRNATTAKALDDAADEIERLGAALTEIRKHIEDIRVYEHRIDSDMATIDDIARSALAGEA